MDLKFPLELDSAGRLETVDGVDETGQRCVVCLNAQHGEWDFDLSFGVPWLDIMSRRPFDRGFARGAVVQQLARQPGVDSVDSVEWQLNAVARTATVQARITASGVSLVV